MARRAPGAVRDLLPAGDAGRGEQRSPALGLDRGEQAQPADVHGQVVVLGLEPERAGHAAAAGVDLVDLGPGDAPQQGDGRGRADERLLVAMAVEQDPPAAERRRLAQPQGAVVDRLGEQLLDQPGRAGDRPAAGSPGSSATCSSRSVSRQHGSTPTIGTPRSAHGASRADIASRQPPAWSSSPLEMLARPQQASLSSRTASRPPPAARWPRGDGRLGAGGERVGQEHDLAAGAGPVRRLAGGAASAAGVAREAGQRRAAARCRAPARAARAQPDARRQVGQRREGRAEPVQRAGRRRTAGPAAARRAVVLVVREELGLERGHVDLERALALARLALQAEVEDLVQALVAQRRVRVGPESAMTSALARPRVACSSSRVAMNDGHMTPLAVLRHSADVHAAVGGARACRPPRSVSRVAQRRRRRAARGRAGARSSAGASTILPGLRRPSRVEQRA